MSLRSRSHVKASMVLTRADHLCTYNYIRSLLNNMRGSNPCPTAFVSDALATEPRRQLYIYIYMLPPSPTLSPDFFFTENGSRDHER